MTDLHPIQQYPRVLGYGDFHVGDRHTFPAITISEAHAITFAGLSGDFNPLHMDEEWARKNSVFGTRVLHGTCTLALVMGPLSLMMAGTALANLGMRFRLVHPVKFADTLRSETEVRSKIDKPKYQGGIVNFGLIGKIQDDTVVFDGSVDVLLRNAAS